MMVRKKIKANYLPGPEDYDYDQLLASIKQSRDLIVKYRSVCGSQVPVRNEADVLLSHIDAFAKLTPIADALERINSQKHPITKC